MEPVFAEATRPEIEQALRHSFEATPEYEKVESSSTLLLLFTFFRNLPQR
jgi:hypothetical protein